MLCHLFAILCPLVTISSLVSVSCYKYTCYSSRITVFLDSVHIIEEHMNYTMVNRRGRGWDCYERVDMMRCESVTLRISRLRLTRTRNGVDGRGFRLSSVKTIARLVWSRCQWIWQWRYHGLGLSAYKVIARCQSSSIGSGRNSRA